MILQQSTDCNHPINTRIQITQRQLSAQIERSKPPTCQLSRVVPFNNIHNQGNIVLATPGHQTQHVLRTTPINYNIRWLDWLCLQPCNGPLAPRQKNLSRFLQHRRPFRRQLTQSNIADLSRRIITPQRGDLQRSCLATAYHYLISGLLQRQRYPQHPL